jgi:hypothetical protein
MSSKRRVSAPAGRVYKSETPLRQSKLPVPKKRITYGKQVRPRVRQVDNTLTQMDFLHVNYQVDEEEDDYGDTGNGTVEQEEDMVDTASMKRGRKRRKTAGDEPSATPQYHTQTITQLDWSFNSAYDEQREHPLEEQPEEPSVKETIVPPVGEPEQETPERDLFDGPYSSSQPRPLRKSKRVEELVKQTPIEPRMNPPPIPSNSMLPPQTPRRPLPREIPSSQSPATPISATRTPAKEHSINSTPIPFNAGRVLRSSPLKRPALLVQDTFETAADSNTQIRSTPPKLPTLMVQDTFETATDVNTQVRSTPQKRSSPAKSVGFYIPEEPREVSEEGVDTLLDAEDSPLSPTYQKGSDIFQHSPILGLESPQEILDSDAEDEESEKFQAIAEFEHSHSHELEQEVEQNSGSDHIQESVATPVGQDSDGESLSGHNDTVLTSMTAPIVQSSGEDEVGPETCYGEIGLETQFEVDKLHTSSVDKDNSGREEELSGAVDGSSTHSQFAHTQMESQRLSIQQVYAMAPRTIDSDIFVSIAHSQVLEFLDRSRDHLTRAWVIPQRTARIWMYEPKPASILRYMAEIGPVKRPGHLTNEEGKGNADFNKRKANSSWTACEIIELYELADPLSLPRLQASEWLMSSPRRYERVPPAVLDQLMANLMTPIFATADGDILPSSATDTQEVEAQLMSTTQQYTRSSARNQSSSVFSSVPSSPPVKDRSRNVAEHDEEPSYNVVNGGEYDVENSSDRPVTHPEFEVPEEEERIPSSQHTTPRQGTQIRPSQATTVDLTQTQTPRHQSVREVVFESPIRNNRSSSPLRLPTLRRANRHENEAPESLVPFSMASSQLLNKSQPLPDSLLADSVFVEPPFVVDSDDDLDD